MSERPPEPEPEPTKRRRTKSTGRSSRRSKVLRILDRDRPFAVVMLLGVVVGGLVLIGVPKFWKTSPSPFPYGEVRVSALDLLQSWSLARSARRAEAAGQDEAALFAWRGAMANNMADPRWHQGVLNYLRRVPAARTDRTLFAIRSASWLMALTQTNLADVALIGEVLERYGRPKVALNWMSGLPLDANLELEKARAKCLLSAGRLDLFAERWRQHGTRWKDDPILAMYQDAWLGSTDDRTAGLEATVRLKEALRVEGEPGLTAARLLILVASAKGQLDDLGRALEVLEKRGSASAAQHGFYWKALAASGRVAEAQALSDAYQQVPNDPEMAAMQWRAMWSIGKTNEALTHASDNLERYGNDLEAWRTYFDLLVESQRWKEAFHAAANARLKASRLEPLYVEAVFTEYRASVGEGRKTDESRLANELGAAKVGDLETLVRISSVLRARDRASEGLQLLKAHESAFQPWPGYWAELFSAGLAAKDVEVLRRSVKELVRIEPGSVAWVNNQAALLLITGDDPPEALRLTLEGLSRNPASPLLKINHALALLRTGRAAEAERILATIASERLPKDGLANFNLAMAEAHLALGRKAKAAEVAGKVDRSRLLGPQLTRLDFIIAQAQGGRAP